MRHYDYKEAYQEKAEELAYEQFGTEFYDLPQDVQYQIYTKAMGIKADDWAAQADLMRDREMEEGLK